MPSQANPACKVTVGAGTVASKEYNTHARSELISTIDNLSSNLPEKNYLLAVKLIEESLKDNLKICELINLIHNEALQNLPDVRQRFFIRFDYGDNFLEVGVNKFANGNIQGFQSVGKKKTSDHK